MIQWHLHKENMRREHGLISVSTLQNSHAAAEELPYVSSDCCSGCHSSVTLPPFLAVRLRIRGFGLSSVGKAAKPFKQTVIYKMRLWKCQAFGGKTPRPTVVWSSTQRGRMKMKNIKSKDDHRFSPDSPYHVK